VIVEPQPDSPLCDVTFSWTETDGDRPAHDVLVRLIALTDHAQDDGDLDPYLLERVEKGVWSGSLRLPSDLRTSYQLCPVRDRPLRGDPPDDERWGEILAAGILDPTSSSTLAASCTFGNPGPASILELPAAMAQPWHARRPDVPRGAVTRHELGRGEGSSVVHIYTPPCPAGREPLPVAVLFDGGTLMTLDATATFDNLLADGVVGPMVAVIVESIRGAAPRGPTRIRSLTDPGLFLPFLLEELMPFVAAGWNVSEDPARTLLVGQSLGGLTAAHAALAAPDRFGAVLGQSSAYWWPGGADGELSGANVIDAYATNPRAPIRFFLEAGATERELVEQNRRMRGVLGEQGYDLSYREYQGGHDYACWRGGLADGLIALLT
jgi:enterochelin esterase family protein